MSEPSKTSKWTKFWQEHGNFLQVAIGLLGFIGFTAITLAWGRLWQFWTDAVNQYPGPTIFMIVVVLFAATLWGWFVSSKESKIWKIAAGEVPTLRVALAERDVRISEMEPVVRADSEWKHHSRRYNMVLRTQSDVVYALRMDDEIDDPLHFACVKCFLEQKLSILESTERGNVLRCPRKEHGIYEFDLMLFPNMLDETSRTIIRYIEMNGASAKGAISEKLGVSSLTAELRKLELQCQFITQLSGGEYQLTEKGARYAETLWPSVLAM